MDSTLAKGLAVLEWLLLQGQPRGVSEVARAFDIARSNAHRTLQTLVACGWVRQDGDGGAYRPSLKVFELGSRVDAMLELRPLLRPHLAELAARCGETIHLAVLDGAEIVYVDKFDSPLPVAAYSRIGGRAPAYCVASGKALLAALDEDPDALKRRLGALVAHTPNSLVDWAALQRDLQRARSRGVAENREEWRLGVCGLGAAVVDARGVPVAAIGMSVPSIRFGRPKVQALTEALVATARAAGATLRGQDPAHKASPRPAHDPVVQAAAQRSTPVPPKALHGASASTLNSRRQAR